jgi:hypothetical protein
MNTTPPSPATQLLPPMGIFRAALLGSVLGWVIMFFPPHFLTIFLAPWVGGLLAGMRARPNVGQAAVVALIMASLITLVAMGLTAAVVAFSVQGGGKGVLDDVKRTLDDTALLATIAAGLWAYCGLAAFGGSMAGSVLKRVG